MNFCKTKGCRRLEWICKDCGHVANTAQFEEAGWIKCSDRLPPNNEYVLVFCEYDIWIGFYDYGRWMTQDLEEDQSWFLNRVLAWQPLPEPPKDEPCTAVFDESGWIKCSERLPDGKVSVSWVYADGKVVDCHISEDHRIWYDVHKKKWQRDTWNGGWEEYRGIVTHWIERPLNPQPPKDEPCK